MTMNFASRIFLILAIPSIWILTGQADGFPLLDGEDLAKEISYGMSEQSQLISEVMRKLALDMKSTVTRILDELEKSESGHGPVKGLRDIADRLDRAVDQGVAEMGVAMQDAIRITNDIAAIMSNTEIANDLTSSIDKSVEEFGFTIRYIGHKIVKVAMQVQMKLNSTNLTEVANETKGGLMEEVNQLMTNWKVGADTADLKDVGYAAAQELSKALQSIDEGFIVIEMSPDMLYILVAVGFTFAVLIVVLEISLKDCRQCVVQACAALGRGMASDGDDEEKDPANLLS